MLLLLCFISCKKENINSINNKNMEQFYYTQEGKVYVLKTVSIKNTFTEIGINSYYALVHVNVPPNTNFESRLTIGLNTTKKIIPVRACFSANETGSGSGEALLDIQSVYYSLIRDNHAVNGNYNSTDHINALTKMSPLTEKAFYTNDNFYGYNIKYGESVLSDNDFIDTSSGLIFYFTPSLALALNNFVINNISTVAGNYFTCVTFTYFELQ